MRRCEHQAGLRRVVRSVGYRAALRFLGLGSCELVFGRGGIVFDQTPDDPAEVHCLRAAANIGVGVKVPSLLPKPAKSKRRMPKPRAAKARLMPAAAADSFEQVKQWANSP